MGRCLDRRDDWRFTGGRKGSAPGIVSSVKPMRELGALAAARKEGESGTETDIVRIEVGDASQLYVKCQ